MTEQPSLLIEIAWMAQQGAVAGVFACHGEHWSRTYQCAPEKFIEAGALVHFYGLAYTLPATTIALLLTVVLR